MPIPYGSRIRPAKASEQAVLQAMIRTARLNPFDLSWEHFLVAESTTGEIVGCIQRKHHGQGVYELASLYVVPAWRKCGIAGALVDTLMDESGPPLWLTCRRRLAPFYSRFGFEIVEETVSMPAYFRRVSRLFKALRIFQDAGSGLTVMRWSEDD